MDLPRFDLSRIWSLIHILIGGALCFFALYILSALVQRGIETLMVNFGVLGAMIFDQTMNAIYIMMFGIVHLPSGFCGGLYTGYKTKENLKIALALPGIIGFVAMILLRYFYGYFDLSNIDWTKDILMPLVGNTIGAYLGGYTLNWPTEEESAEEGEKITLYLEEGEKEKKKARRKRARNNSSIVSP